MASDLVTQSRSDSYNMASNARELSIATRTPLTHHG